MARTSTTKTLNTTPPKTVANAAARGLRLREQHRRGGTAIGVARARDLSAQKQLSAQTIRRMHAYFARHSVDKTGKGWADRTKPSAGYIAWLLWGGDAGQRWAERLHARLQAGDNKQTGAATQKAASTKSSAKKMRRKPMQAPPRRTAEHVQPQRSARLPARARQRKPRASARHSRAACGRAPPRRWLPKKQQATRRLPRNPPARGLHPGKSPTRPRHPGHCRLRRKPKPRPAPRLQAVRTPTWSTTWRLRSSRKPGKPRSRSGQHNVVCVGWVRTTRRRRSARCCIRIPCTGRGRLRRRFDGCSNSPVRSIYPSGLHRSRPPGSAGAPR